MISVKHLSKVFKDGDRELPVLRDVNCEIVKGEVIGIIGPSGTGKSTFLRCLNRLEEPSGGQIEIDGVDILNRKTDVNQLRRKMGMVFQNFNLFHHLTILDNITLCPHTLLGKSCKEAEARAMELLQLVGLYDKAGSLPSELSGGQKQRAAIARCLAMDPEIILFDEPTSALDPTMVSEVLVVIRRLASEGMTMAIVSHEMQFIRSVSTRIFFMNEGVIYEEGSPEQIFEHPQHPATIAFVNRIRTLEFKLSDRHFDFYGMLGEVGIFCNKYGLGNDMLTKVQHVIEEMLYGIMPFGGSVTVTLDYSEKDFTLRLLFAENDCTTPVLNRQPEDYLPLKIVQGMCTSLNESEAGKILVEM
jgi:polar amino acid transport system ATP-binding protein